MKTVRFVVEVPRGGFIKFASDGSIDFVSPLPSLFNYGSIPGTLSEDGEPHDGLHVGPRAARGTELEAPMRGVVRFVDGPHQDNKWVLKPGPLTRADRAQIDFFFTVYARLKSLRRSPASRYLGFVDL